MLTPEALACGGSTESVLFAASHTGPLILVGRTSPDTLTPNVLHTGFSTGLGFELLSCPAEPRAQGSECPVTADARLTSRILVQVAICPDPLALLSRQNMPGLFPGHVVT